MKKYTLSRQFSNLFAFKNSHHLDKHPLAAEITAESHRSRKFTISILLYSQTIRRLIIPLLQISLCTFGSLVAVGKISLAQVTSDGTVNTQVNQNGNVAEITGGETRGSNLFHSFQDFSVSTGNEAFFNNASDISNILGRVTGGNISNIDGLIRANGSADLFLVNPAGIMFGENASLDIGGSFYGSSATSILFDSGEFSAADLENPPLLTVNAPIGLSFRDEPGDIVNNSVVNNVGLEVNPGNTLALIGGDINFEAGDVTASGGNIELGGLSQAGTVGINEDRSLSFPGDVAKADINLNNGADVDARGTGGGNITINARNLNLSAGESGRSFIRAGILDRSTSAEAQPGDVTINVAENIVLDGSSISNQVSAGGVGNSGNITINSNSIEAVNGGAISASTFGQGNAGTIDINATKSITIDGEDSGIASGVAPGAVGNAGGVTIEEFDNLPEDAVAAVNISTENLTISNGGVVNVSTAGQGNGGLVAVEATKSITIDGEGSGIGSGVGEDAVGRAFGVLISTENLTISNGGVVNVSTLGQGDAGVVILGSENENIENITIDGQGSSIFSAVASGAVGNGLGVLINSTNLTLSNGGVVNVSTFGQGDAGVVILGSENENIENITIDGQGSSIESMVASGAVGNGLDVLINSTNLTLSNGGQVNVSTAGQGNAGDVEIDAEGDISFDDAIVISLAAENAEGSAGDVDINAEGDIFFENNSTISTQSLNDNFNGGDLNIDARFIVAFPSNGIGNDLIATAVNGSGGDINLDVEQVFGLQAGDAVDIQSESIIIANGTNDIDASSDNVSGLDGTITINTADINPVQGATELPSNTVELGQTTAQTCKANREVAATNSLTIEGKGGVAPSPDLPLNSENISIEGENPDSVSTIPQAVETSQGKIQPARGVKITKSGKVILTAYRTDNSGERLPEIKRNCGMLPKG